MFLYAINYNKNQWLSASTQVMEDKFKFVVRGRKEENKFVLEEITNYILKNLESFDDKTIIVTFELPVTPNKIKTDSGILINWCTIISII